MHRASGVKTWCKKRACRIQLKRAIFILFVILFTSNTLAVAARSHKLCNNSTVRHSARTTVSKTTLSDDKSVARHFMETHQAQNIYTDSEAVVPDIQFMVVCTSIRAVVPALRWVSSHNLSDIFIPPRS